jgi:hypothetical protein
VFAIAITLLIIEVGVNEEGGSLARRLAEQWPSYVAFVVSFAVIGIMWLNHHQMFRSIRVADHGLFVLNLALLLVVSFIPLPTKIVGEELHGTFADRRTAAPFYGSTFVAVSVVFNALWLWAARQTPDRARYPPAEHLRPHAPHFSEHPDFYGGDPRRVLEPRGRADPVRGHHPFLPPPRRLGESAPGAGASNGRPGRRRGRNRPARLTLPIVNFWLRTNFRC